MKARSRAQKRRNKPGPKPRADVLRTPSGRISQSVESQDTLTRIEMEAATWKRRQINPALAPEEARKQEHGSVIAQWLQEYLVMKKRQPERNHPNEFTQIHHDTAQKYHGLYLEWLSTIEAKRVLSSSDFNRSGGYDGRDPFSKEIARKQARTEAAFKDARRAVLESGPLGMMAIEAIVIENKPVENLRGDLRQALNRLAILWKFQAAT